MNLRRDSGIVHTLLRLDDVDGVIHPAVPATARILTGWLNLLGRQHRPVYHYAFVGTGVRASGPRWSFVRYALNRMD